MADTATIEQPTTTPVTAPDAAPAAPATSASASTPTTSERPSSFAAALEQVAAQSEKAAATPPAPAATAPVASATPAGEIKSPTTPGPVPFPDHQKIIENTRTKTRAEVSAEFDREFGWARQVSREDFQEIASVAKRLHSDPIGLYTWLGEQIAAHPVYGPQLKARPSTEEPQPDVEIRGDNGQVVGMTYSHQRLAEREAWLKRGLKQEYAAELAPLREAHERAQREARERETTTKIDTATSTVLSRIDKILDGRTKELGGKVNELLTADPRLDPIDAAFQVRDSVIKPELETKAREAAVKEQQHKALGNTANGNGAVVAPAVRPKNPKELATYLATLDGARAS